jgi:mercuric ion transport protein
MRVKAVERGAPVAAIIAALSTLACCLPFGIVGAAGLASVSIWIAPLRPWLLGAAVLLLILGFWQVYKRPNQCSTRRSRMSLALFWLSAVIVVLATVFPQLISNWIAG